MGWCALGDGWIDRLFIFENQADCADMSSLHRFPALHGKVCDPLIYTQKHVFTPSFLIAVVCAYADFFLTSYPSARWIRTYIFLLLLKFFPFFSF